MFKATTLALAACAAALAGVALSVAGLAASVAARSATPAAHAFIVTVLASGAKADCFGAPKNHFLVY
jgi:hypothetical protein